MSPTSWPNCSTLRCYLQLLMARAEGFEPPQDVNPLPVFKTGPFSQTWVSPHLLYINNSIYKSTIQVMAKFNLIIWRSERGSNPWPPPWQGGVLTNWTIEPYGAVEGNRTPNLLITSQLHYQLCYGGISLIFFNFYGGPCRTRTYDTPVNSRTL